MPIRRRLPRATSLLLVTSIASAQTVLSPERTAAAVDHFENRIRPVLASRCYGCHSGASAAPQGGLSLNTAAGIRKGGNSGPVISPGNPDASLLVRAIRQTDAKLKMPPGGKPLPPETIADFAAWITAGAPMPSDPPQIPAESATKPQLWSLRKPERPAIPDVKEGTDRNAIDRFILARLQEKGLSLSPVADRRTLIRRATFDLIGLPPTAAEVSEFVNDKRPDAYERLIDRLLASPHYGERWGRHWLDVARYADSFNDSVNEGRRFPWSYTYRDWVIRSLNEDLPYDQFLLYQLAADRVVAPKGSADPKHLAALGFLSLGREFPGSYPETVDDRIDAVSRGMLGLTVACARCHDHKYDPIPTKDYYSFYSIFSNVREARELPRLTLAPEQRVDAKQSVYQERLLRVREAEKEYRERRNREMVAFFKTQIAEYLVASHDAAKLTNPEVEDLVRDRQLNAFMLRRWSTLLKASKQSGEPVFRTWHRVAEGGQPDLAGAHPAIREAMISAGTPNTLKEIARLYAAVLTKYDRTEEYSTDAAAEQLRRLMHGPDSPADVPVEEFEDIATEGDKNNLRSIRVRYEATLVRAAYDGAEPRAMAVEDVANPKPSHVFLRGNPNNPGALAPARFLTCLGGGESELFNDGSGRLDLARAIIDPANPLTARVIVNRVWMHHFGSGLVRTPSDFGFRGEQPTHLELLDYLAVRLQDDFGWSLKKLHRAIMTSATYRQASADNPSARAIDPENQLLWRMNRRRLEIEAVRDAALAAAARLDVTPGGVPFPLTAEPSVPRRSIYGFVERGRLPAFLSAFDFASPDQHSPMRYVTTVPQQALFFLNSTFIAEQARHIAARNRTIPEMYRAILGRDPEASEIEAGERFLQSTTQEDVAPPTGSVWMYGILEGDAEDFVPFSSFAGDRWQGAPVLPTVRFGKATLRAGGGEPGDREPVLRRWVSPVAGKITIEGTLRHGQPAVPYGDGVRGRIRSSAHGELASYNVNGNSAETKLTGISVEKGDTIDFIVNARGDVENDNFSWSPTIRQGEQSWNAAEEFAGPRPAPLNARERYAQVLLQTNEFSFID